MRGKPQAPGAPVTRINAIVVAALEFAERSRRPPAPGSSPGRTRCRARPRRRARGARVHAGRCAGEIPPPRSRCCCGWARSRLPRAARSSRAAGGGALQPDRGRPRRLRRDLLDSAVGCAVHTTWLRGSGYSTLALKAKIVRVITRDSGRVRCEAEVLHRGRRQATADARLVDADTGKLLAHGTGTCLSSTNGKVWVAAYDPGSVLDAAATRRRPDLIPRHRAAGVRCPPPRTSTSFAWGSAPIRRRRRAEHVRAARARGFSGGQRSRDGAPRPRRAALRRGLRTAAASASAYGGRPGRGCGDREAASSGDLRVSCSNISVDFATVPLVGWVPNWRDARGGDPIRLGPSAGRPGSRANEGWRADRSPCPPRSS